MLFEDGLIDVCILVCEQNKVGEWLRDYKKFTKLEAKKYKGDKRKKVLEDLPQVLVTTYETARNDIAKKVKIPGPKGRQIERLVPNFLTEALSGKRVFFIYDEASKLGNRGSLLYKSHEVFIESVTKTPGCRMLGMTATPIERGPENHYNLGRLMLPKGALPTVAEFDAKYTAGKDEYDRYRGFRNLTPEENFEPDIPPLSSYFDGIMMRKRKTDPDVIDQFPEVDEKFVPIRLAPVQQQFYEAVEDTFSGPDTNSYIVRRQIAAHPMALLNSDGEVAKAIVNEVGRAGLEALGSTKTDFLTEFLTPIVKGQGAQVIVFSFFINSIGEYLQAALQKAGMDVVLHYGEMSDKDKEGAKDRFRAGKHEIFLTSDSGKRGINLPEALYVVEYEMAMTHADRTQRLNRNHRIDSKHPSVSHRSFITLGTVEESIAQNVMTRNEWADQMLDLDADENFTTAGDRRKKLATARRA